MKTIILQNGLSIQEWSVAAFGLAILVGANLAISGHFDSVARLFF
ncbi:MAG TPA: hypothetical protein VFE62_03035 [Gemmataceae bacterium]|nr:hypothetical protein [Gemmataceae bacterium]